MGIIENFVMGRISGAADFHSEFTVRSCRKIYTTEEVSQNFETDEELGIVKVGRFHDAVTGFENFLEGKTLEDIVKDKNFPDIVREIYISGHDIGLS
jgi:hypothetical protein